MSAGSSDGVNRWSHHPPAVSSQLTVAGWTLVLTNPCSAWLRSDTPWSQMPGTRPRSSAEFLQPASAPSRGVDTYLGSILASCPPPLRGMVTGVHKHSAIIPTSRCTLNWVLQVRCFCLRGPEEARRGDPTRYRYISTPITLPSALLSGHIAENHTRCPQNLAYVAVPVWHVLGFYSITLYVKIPLAPPQPVPRPVNPTPSLGTYTPQPNGQANIRRYSQPSLPNMVGRPVKLIRDVTLILFCRRIFRAFPAIQPRSLNLSPWVPPNLHCPRPLPLPAMRPD